MEVISSEPHVTRRLRERPRVRIAIASYASTAAAKRCQLVSAPRMRNRIDLRSELSWTAPLYVSMQARSASE